MMEAVRIPEMFAILLSRNNDAGQISEEIFNDLGGKVKTYVGAEPVVQK
jgi:hypothetical protein